jgi:hypothetical protein
MKVLAQLRAVALSLALAMGVTAGIVVTAPHAEAATIDFENTGGVVQPGFGTVSEIPDGYGSFNWVNFDTLHSQTQWGSEPDSGYINGTVSGDYVAFNHFADPASISRAENFNFISAAFTAAWYDDLQLDIAGFRDGVQIYSTTLTLTTEFYSTLFLNWFDLDEITFASYGGTNTQFPAGHRRQFVMDDLQYSNVVATPIPAALPLFATAMLGLGVIARRRARKQAQAPVI